MAGYTFPVKLLAWFLLIASMASFVYGVTRWRKRLQEHEQERRVERRERSRGFVARAKERRMAAGALCHRSHLGRFGRAQPAEGAMPFEELRAEGERRRGRWHGDAPKVAFAGEKGMRLFAERAPPRCRIRQLI